MSYSFDKFYNESPENAQDYDLWHELKRGDRNALSKIYVIHFQHLMNYGLRFTKQSEIVEDAVQELFIDIWNTRNNLGEVQSIKSYLFSSLRRRIIKVLLNNRKTQTLNLLVDVYDFDIELSEKSGFLNDQMLADQKQQLMFEVNKLSARQKEALFLLFFDELSYKEAAAIMQIKIRTIYNIAHSAIQALKANITRSTLTDILIPLLTFIFLS